MAVKDLSNEYKQSLKSLDTEETIDLWFYRPLGFAWAKLFSKLGIKPNAVTPLSPRSIPSFSEIPFPAMVTPTAAYAYFFVGSFSISARACSLSYWISFFK